MKALRNRQYDAAVLGVQLRRGSALINRANFGNSLTHPRPPPMNNKAPAEFMRITRPTEKRNGVLGIGGCPIASTPFYKTTKIVQNFSSHAGKIDHVRVLLNDKVALLYLS